MCLATEAVDAAVHRLLTPDEDGRERDSRPVLNHALTQSAWVLERAIHLHGGMGFTWELPLHRGLREIRKLDAAFDLGARTQQAGRDFIAAC
jgi:alkylation response protein AidB-like acyl-CoA dehydrogenase